MVRQRHEGGEISFPIDQMILDIRTDKSRVQVVGSPEVGRILLIDNQVKVLDKYSYHLSELLARPLLKRRGGQQKVLIIGKGNFFLTDYLSREPNLDISILESDEVLACVSRKVMDYKIGNAMLFCADNRLSWLSDQKAESFDCLICDQAMTMNLAERASREKYKSFLLSLLPQAHRLLKPGGIISMYAGGLNISRNRPKLPNFLKWAAKNNGFRGQSITSKFVGGFGEQLSLVTASK